MPNKAFDDIYLMVRQGENGGIVDSCEMARDLAELILRYSKSHTASQQLPLHVEDRGESWFVQGSLNPELKKPGWGPFEIEIRKRDAAITNMVQHYNYQDMPSTNPPDDSK